MVKKVIGTNTTMKMIRIDMNDASERFLTSVTSLRYIGKNTTANINAIPRGAMKGFTKKNDKTSVPMSRVIKKEVCIALGVILKAYHICLRCLLVEVRSWFDENPEVEP